MDSYIIRIPKNDRTENIINFIKNGDTPFDSTKLKFPRGMKSQSERAIWLFEMGFLELEKELPLENKKESYDLNANISKKDTLIEMLR